MLERYPAALAHILNAEKHNIALYRKKLRDRQHRQKMELLDKKEKILMGNGKTQQATEIDNESEEIEIDNNIGYDTNGSETISSCT